MTGVNHAKLDAALALALDEAGDADVDLVVSVELQDDPVGIEESLTRMGLDAAGPGDRMRSATLSPAQVAELSQAPWVRRIHLSQRLRLSDELPRLPTRPEGSPGAG